MATPIAMPRQGQSVETCTIIEWNKTKGDDVQEGDVLFTYETDKASFEFESPVSGKLLEVFAAPDEDVPVLQNVAVIGADGEDVEPFRPEAADAAGSPDAAAPPPDAAPAAPAERTTAKPPPPDTPSSPRGGGPAPVSPRARHLATDRGIDTAAIDGTGPHGRIIERDVRAAVGSGQVMTKAAAVESGAGGKAVPAAGTGIGGRIRAADLFEPGTPALSGLDDAVTEVKLSNMRKIIAGKMVESLTTAAQLTLHSSADASSLLAYRRKVKAGAEALDLQNITINDLVCFVTARVLARFPNVNCLLENDTLKQYANTHLALAVDTERGLMVPVIRFANLLSLNEMSAALKTAAVEAQQGTISPDMLSGGTFTVTNLGGLGIEAFTPVLNPPQVAILGVNNIQPRPAVAENGEAVTRPRLGLSLTIDHRALDGAPAARFLQALVSALENVELTLAV